jgi:carboxypeptidase Q
MLAWPKARPFVLSVLALGSACAASPPPEASPPSVPAEVAVTSTAPAPSASTARAAVETTPLPDEVRQLQRSILEAHGALDVVQSLTTEVGARLAGSPGDKLAVAWALETMRSRGLVHVHSEGVKVPVWQRGVETASIVQPVRHKLVVTALGWSGATPAAGVEADVIRFDSLDALKAENAKIIAGKIVFLDVRMKETRDDPGYGTAVVARGSGPGEAAKKGALAIVIRSIGSDESRFPHTGAMHKEKDMKSALPAGAISNADADLLERVLAARGSARLALNLGPRWLPDADSANVVGEIPGRERPSEVVLLGAHLDSWDLGEGAIDDGAGCGIVLEAGRALAVLPTKPRRTIRVVLFAAEENSLSGGKEYAKAHAAEALTFIAAMEADLGTGKARKLRMLGGPDTADRLRSVAALLEPLGVPSSDEKAHGGSDISPLRSLGVPIVDLAQDPGRYFDAHHTANDTLARIDSGALTQAAAAFATAAWGIAEMSGYLGRVPEVDREHD